MPIDDSRELFSKMHRPNGCLQIELFANCLFLGIWTPRGHNWQTYT